MKKTIMLLTICLSALMLLPLSGCTNDSGEIDDLQSEPVAEIEEPKSVMECATFKIDGIYVDESYVASTSSELKRVCLFATVGSDSKDLRVSSGSSCCLKFADNLYKPEFVDKHTRVFTPNYYYSKFIEDVYTGAKLKILFTYLVPQGALSGDTEFTLSYDAFEGIDDISFTAEDIIHCKDYKEIAEKVDPAGYSQALIDTAPADVDTASRFAELCAGCESSTRIYVDSSSYMTITAHFCENNGYYVTLNGLDGEQGVYEVLNKYLAIYYNNESEPSVYVPYTWSDKSDYPTADLDTAYSPYA